MLQELPAVLCSAELVETRRTDLILEAETPSSDSQEPEIQSSNTGTSLVISTLPVVRRKEFEPRVAVTMK